MLMQRDQQRPVFVAGIGRSVAAKSPAVAYDLVAGFADVGESLAGPDLIASYPGSYRSRCKNGGGQQRTCGGPKTRYGPVHELPPSVAFAAYG
jgi:hypothetical protein